MKKPKILLTNDDGIDAKGLWHLWRAISSFAEVFIIAPSTEKSGVGLSLTLHKPLMIHSASWENNAAAWKINGTPADCIRFGLHFVVKEKPDIILSGINRGSNAGRNVLYSGTIGGVIEGAMRQIPGIAFSCVEHENPRYNLVEPYVVPLVRYLLDHPMARGSLLNVNFPDSFDQFKGIKLARQGMGRWVEDPDERVHPDGAPYFWHGGTWSHHEEHEESDVALLKEGYITAVPIHIDELTDHRFIQERKERFESHFLADTLKFTS